MRLIYIIFLIVLSIINSQNNSNEEEESEENKFKNECGPLTPLDPEKYDNNNLLNQCKSNETISSNCCLLTGVYQLKDKALCVNISDINDSEERIEKIKYYHSEGITKLKLQCESNEKRELISTCNEDVKDKNPKNCYKKEGNKVCCYVKITNSENDGEACRWFDENMDNDIRSEAIMAAKTIGVKLKVECSAKNYKYNSILLLALLYIIL